MSQIYAMLRDTLSPEGVLAAAGDQPEAVFFAHLYLGLYFEALGNRARALEHITAAAADRYAAGGRLHARGGAGPSGDPEGREVERAGRRGAGCLVLGAGCVPGAGCRVRAPSGMDVAPRTQHGTWHAAPDTRHYWRRSNAAISRRLRTTR